MAASTAGSPAPSSRARASDLVGGALRHRPVHRALVPVPPRRDVAQVEAGGPGVTGLQRGADGALAPRHRLAAGVAGEGGARREEQQLVAPGRRRGQVRGVERSAAGPRRDGLARRRRPRAAPRSPRPRPGGRVRSRPSAKAARASSRTRSSSSAPRRVAGDALRRGPAAWFGTSPGGACASRRARRARRSVRRRTGGWSPAAGSAWGARRAGSTRFQSTSRPSTVQQLLGRTIRDVRRSGEVEGCGEHRRRAQHHLLVLVEQVVAPVDGGAQRAVPVVARMSVAEHVVAAAERQLQPVQAEARRTRRGELDRERHAVERAGRSRARCRAPRRSSRSATPLAAIRAAKSATASPSSSRRVPGTAKTVSPARCSRIRLVARTRSDGQAPSRAVTEVRAPTSRCSQLSRTTSTSRSRSVAASASSRVVPARSGTPTASAIADDDHVVVGHRHQVDERDPVARRRRPGPRRRARHSRVLPTPPGPVAVTRRLPRSAHGERRTLRRTGR